MENREDAERETFLFLQRMKEKGWTPIDSINDILPDGHPLKNKELKEANALFNAWSNGEITSSHNPETKRQETGQMEQKTDRPSDKKRPRSAGDQAELSKSLRGLVPFQPEAQGASPDPKIDFFHLYDTETLKTYCGIDMLPAAIGADDGTWREGRTDEFSAKPCPACIKAKMGQDGEENSSDQGFLGRENQD